MPGSLVAPTGPILRVCYLRDLRLYPFVKWLSNPLGDFESGARSALGSRYIRLTARALSSTTPLSCYCLLYTSDAADDLLCVDLGGRRIIKKKKKIKRN